MGVNNLFCRITWQLVVSILSALIVVLFYRLWEDNDWDLWSHELSYHKMVSKVSEMVSKVSVSGNWCWGSDILVSEVEDTFWPVTSVLADGWSLLVRGYLSLMGVVHDSMHLILPCFDVGLFWFCPILKQTFLMHCDCLVCVAYSGMYFPLI